jgi:hypothetical protein
VAAASSRCAFEPLDLARLCLRYSHQEAHHAGITSLLVNDPEGVRHFLAANAANYRRPSSVRRVTIPLVEAAGNLTILRRPG